MLNKTDRRFHWAWLSEHNSIFRADMIVINKLLQQVEGNIFIDLGCFIGGFTVPMAREAIKRGGKVYSVDLYDKTPPTPGNFYFEHIKNPCMEYFMENMMGAGVWEGISLSQGYSWELADRFSDESVDFIWIDADHHYSSVIKDIRAWWPKLRKGGIIAGHDYTDEGVKLAVREFFDDYTVHCTRNESWSKRKE